MSGGRYVGYCTKCHSKAQENYVVDQQHKAEARYFDPTDPWVFWPGLCDGPVVEASMEEGFRMQRRDGFVPRPHRKGLPFSARAGFVPVGAEPR